MSGLVLSIFPGIDLLGRAFEEQGWCVVRGPDVIWGGDIRTFHPPAGVFEGVIGGPPCQAFSALAPLVRHQGYEPRFGNLIPEFERVVAEAAPDWFVMENVRGAPVPEIEGYDRWSELLMDADVGGVQPRVRRISLGFREGVWAEPLRSPFTWIEYDPMPATATSPLATDSAIAYEEVRRRAQRTVTTNSVGGSFGDTRRDPDSGRPRRQPMQHSITAGHGPPPGQRDARRGTVLTGGQASPNGGPRLDIADMLEAQGLPRDYLDHAPFTVHGKRSVVGNGVPMAMGRAIAKAVRRGMGLLDYTLRDPDSGTLV